MPNARIMNGFGIHCIFGGRPTKVLINLYKSVGNRLVESERRS